MGEFVRICIFNNENKTGKEVYRDDHDDQRVLVVNKSHWDLLEFRII